MYGWTVTLLLAFLLLPARSTGSNLAQSLFARLEDSRRARFLTTKTPDCTDAESAVTVRCRPRADMETAPPSNASNSSRSRCCSFGVRNSTRNPCLADDRGNAHLHGSPSDCLLRIPVAVESSTQKRPLVVYELLSCAGSSLSVECEANLSCGDRGATWRKGEELSEPLPPGPHLNLTDVQRADSGTYLCDVTDREGRTKLGVRVTISVQFPPVILVPNHTSSSPWSGDVLECSAEAVPAATVSWFRDGQRLEPDDPRYGISSESDDCTTTSRLLLLLPGNESGRNYTCVASNEHGRTAVTLLLVASVGAAPSERRRFNVTGFIIGMLPPLFISFYIILKLGYRSRYAEERGEDDGFREEPFFISY